MTEPPTIPNTATSEHRVVSIPVDLIAPGIHQARRQFAEAALDELAASIVQSGVIQPVVVCGDRKSGYTLLAGERRWRAAARAGVHELPAIVRNDLSDDEAAIVGLIENLQRESLGIMDTARGLHSLSNSHGLTHDAVATRIGKSRAYVSNYLRILALAEPVQTLLDAGELSLGHAKVLAGIDGQKQAALARHAASRQLSVRALERLARQQAEPAQRKRAATVGNPDLSTLEHDLSAHLGNNVHISYAAERRHGQLRIDFHDLDEFDGLLARLGFDPD